jgi:hypothetical protein
VQVPFEDGDLVPEGEDFSVLVTVIHRQEPEQRERVGHAEVGQSKQHSGSSLRSNRRDPRRVGVRQLVAAADLIRDQTGHDQDG